MQQRCRCLDKTTQTFRSGFWIGWVWIVQSNCFWHWHKWTGASSSGLENWSPDYAGNLAMILKLLLLWLTLDFWIFCNDLFVNPSNIPQNAIHSAAAQRVVLYWIWNIQSMSTRFHCLALQRKHDWNLALVMAGSGGRRESSIKQDRRDSQILGHKTKSSWFVTFTCYDLLGVYLISLPLD